MKAIMVMFDSLNRHLLPPYGCEAVHAPNFRRLAEKTVVFDRAYVASMPCMPARRDIHTGRPNFLHTNWGPLEPYDDSMPEMLKKNGVYSHLATDHFHYFEDGGANYHARYSSWEFFRGQEGDPWTGQVADPEIPPCVHERHGGKWRQDWVNRAFMCSEELQPQPQTFRAGIDFVRRNQNEDNWFLQLETFDPHEPFFSQQKYKDLYAEHYDTYEGRHYDWPVYRHVEESPEEAAHCRHEYLALLSMCDAYLGEVLDLMDELDLWRDTMLIVNTDHGFLLGEHDCWAKMWMPWYQELANIPFFVWDPRSGKCGERRQALVQTIDLAPTLLDYFGLEPTPDMTGHVLGDTIDHDAPVREAGVFGAFGGHVNVTDGRYVYMRAAAADDNRPLFQYTLMPARMADRIDVADLGAVELSEPFSFTKGCRLPKFSGRPMFSGHTRTLLFDVEADPRQEAPMDDAAVEKMMTEHLIREMRACDAPAEQYVRLGL